MLKFSIFLLSVVAFAQNGYIVIPPTGASGGPTSWPTGPGLTVCTGSPCTAWGTSISPTAPVFTTSVTSPQFYGGSAVGSILTLSSTSNGSPSGDYINLVGSIVKLNGTAFGTAATMAGPTGAIVGVGQANTYGNFLQDFSGGSVKLPATVTVGSATITFPGVTSTLASLGANTFTAAQTISSLIGGTAASSHLDLQSTSGVGATDYIRGLVGNNGATEAFRCTSNGNCGFGTTTPGSALSLGVGAADNTSGLRFGTDTAFYRTGDGVVRLYSLDADNPNFLLGGTGGAAATYQFNGSLNTVFLNAARTGGKISLQTNSGVTALTIDDSQNVGIGTTTPGATEQINGSLCITVTSTACPSPGAGNLLVSGTAKTAIEQITSGYSAAGTPIPACASGLLLQRAGVLDATVNTPGSTYISGGTYTITVQCVLNSTGTVYAWQVD